MKLRKFLKEAVETMGWPDTGGIAGDDDAPTGNILLGRKYTKKIYQGLAGPYVRSVPDDEWTWDQFEHAKGMEIKSNYHKTLDDMRAGYEKRLWRHTKPKGKAGDRPLGIDAEELIRGEEESAPAYVERVVSHMEPREVSHKNLPAVVFKINYVLGQEADTHDPGVHDADDESLEKEYPEVGVEKAREI